MKILAIWMAAGVMMAGMLWADSEVPEVDAEVDVFPNQEDAMLRKLMGEMLKDAEQDRREMERPVELPKIDAPHLRRLLERAGVEPAPRQPWGIGIQLRVDDQSRIVVDGVLAGSPAAKAGLAAGDVLVDLNGIRLRDPRMLIDLLQVVRDQEVELRAVRGSRWEVMRLTPVRLGLPGGRAPGDGAERDVEVLRELRGMRSLMEEMLKEIKKQTPKVRRIPTPPSSRPRQSPAPPQN